MILWKYVNFVQTIATENYLQNCAFTTKQLVEAVFRSFTDIADRWARLDCDHL